MAATLSAVTSALVALLCGQMYVQGRVNVTGHDGTSATVSASTPGGTEPGLYVRCVSGCSGGGGASTQGNAGTNAQAWYVRLGDGANLLSLLATNPAGTEYAVPVRNIPSGTQAVSIASMPSTPVTGPLTDTQLRASAVPISGTVSVNALPASSSVIGHVVVDTAPAVTGTVTANAGTGTLAVSLASVPTHAVSESGTWTVTGAGGTFPVTGTFWQATQPVSGTVTANAGSGTMAVSGPVTDAQLRASAVPVSGTFFQATQPVSGTFWQATQPVSGTVAAQGADPMGNAKSIPLTVAGAAFVEARPVAALNPFLPRCNAVRRTGCQP